MISQMVDLHVHGMGAAEPFPLQLIRPQTYQPLFVGQAKQGKTNGTSEHAAVLVSNVPV